VKGDSDLDKLEALSERIKRAEDSARNSAGTKGESLNAATNKSMIALIRVGSDFVAMIVLSVFAGLFLDRYLNTAPWIMVTLLCLAFVSGFWMMIRMLGQRSDEQKPSDAKEKE
jgi:F0F1-type ATP synthase assembly protein I